MTKQNSMYTHIRTYRSCNFRGMALRMAQVLCEQVVGTFWQFYRVKDGKVIISRNVALFYQNTRCHKEQNTCNYRCNILKSCTSKAQMISRLLFTNQEYAGSRKWLRKLCLYGSQSLSHNNGRKSTTLDLVSAFWSRENKKKLKQQHCIVLRSMSHKYPVRTYMLAPNTGISATIIFNAIQKGGVYRYCCQG